MDCSISPCRQSILLAGHENTRIQHADDQIPAQLRRDVLPMSKYSVFQALISSLITRSRRSILPCAYPPIPPSTLIEPRCSFRRPTDLLSPVSMPPCSFLCPPLTWTHHHPVGTPTPVSTPYDPPPAPTERFGHPPRISTSHHLFLPSTTRSDRPSLI